jgi:hypothetical protein
MIRNFLADSGRVVGDSKRSLAGQGASRLDISEYRRLFRTWDGAVLAEMLLQLRRIQAIGNTAEVHDAHTPGGQKPGFPEDSEARVLVQS